MSTATLEATADVPTRDARQKDLVPPRRLRSAHPIVVGVGAIGRQVAIQLAATGVPRLTLVDHDTVEVVNLGPQAYKARDVGRAKVFATAEDCQALNPDLLPAAYHDRFNAHERGYWLSGEAMLEPVVFCCVDSMAARKFIWEAVKPKARLFVDGRMAAEVLRVVTSAAPPADEYYATTLFSDAEAYQGSCTARSTVYSSSVVAGLMVGTWARWLRDLPVERDVTLNLLAAELSVT